MDHSLETDDEKRRRVLAAIGGSFPTMPETPPLQMGRRIDLPEQTITADPERIPGPDAISPPQRMSADEFPSADPTPPPPMADELPPDAPPLARLGQMHAAAQPEPDAAPPRESHSGFGGGMGWALVADALLNRGRGTGGILALGSSGATEDRNLKREYTRAQIDELQHRHEVSPEAQAYKDAMMQYRWDALHQRGDSAQGVQGRFDRNEATRDDPNSARRQTEVTQAGLTSGASTKARLDTESAANPRTANDRATIAAAEAAARIGTEHGLAPMTTADAADKARTVGYAGNDPKLDYERKMNPVLADRGTFGVGAGLDAESIARANPGLNVSDPALLQQALKTRTVNQKTLEDIKAANRGGEIVQRLHDTAAEYQALPTVEKFGNKGAKLRHQYDGHAEEYAGVIGKVTGNNSVETHRESLGLVPNIHNPLAAGGIEGLWSPLEANINGNLGAIGITAAKPAFLREVGAQPSAANTPAAAELPGRRRTPAANGGGQEPPLPTGAREQASDLISDEDPPMIADNGDGTFDVYEPGKPPRSNVRLSPAVLEAARRPGSGWTIR